MYRRRKTKRSQKAYKRRKAIVEAPFGWLKSVMGFRQLSMRGIEKANGEWRLVWLAINLKRMSQRLEWST